MPTKYITFKGQDEAGNIFCQPILPYSDSELVKTASSNLGSRLHPAIKKFISSIKKTDKGIYVLVSALGASEYWGGNSNADHIGEDQLVHAPEGWDKMSHSEMLAAGNQWPYGYPTFMAASVYPHHKNQDKNKRIGDICIAIYNTDMHRVELVLYVDKQRCREQDCYSVIDKLEAGLFPDVSMGLKTIHDICNICNKKARTEKDYCEHLDKENPFNIRGKILPDGKRCVMINIRPRFFDLSMVFVGAEKTAKVMIKLAHKDNKVCMGSYCAIPGLEKTASHKHEESCCDDCGDFEKLASAHKHASISKKSEIDKEYPADFNSYSSDMDLPKELLNTLGSLPLNKALSTTSSLGIVLKPKEFQRIILINIGESSMADSLDQSGCTFMPSNDIDDCCDLHPSSNHNLLKLLKNLVPKRSVFEPHLSKRMTIMIKSATAEPSFIKNSMLEKIAAAYNGYRKELVKKAYLMADNFLNNPGTRFAIYGDELVNAFTSGITKTANSSGLSPESLDYLSGAFYPNSSPLKAKTSSASA